MKATFVSAADSYFFDLLLDLIHSIRACPESRDFDVCILDVGLKTEQLAVLTPLVARIVSPAWDLQFDHSRSPSWLRAMISRPHLPRHFPEYDLVIWVDADAWLCNWDAVGLLVRAAQDHGLAIVPELDRSYNTCFGLRPEIHEGILLTYLEGFGNEAAQRLSNLPVINSGVFAMRRDVPYWNIWSEILAKAVLRSTRAMIEQCALNLGIYTGQIQAHFLPSWCNWNCGASRPILNWETRELYCRLLPHERISICHLIGVRGSAVDLTCVDGSVRQMPLIYRMIRGK